MASESLEIPDKQRFKIGEVANLLDLEPYVLRYWETEFDVLAPDKTDSGQRVYCPDDIELVHTIKDLPHNEIFTIAGARRQLERKREGKRSMLDPQPADSDEEVVELRETIEELEVRNHRLEERAEKAVQKQRDLEESNEKLRRRLTELDEADSEQITALEHDVDQLESELAETRDQLAELRAERDELLTKLDGHAAMPSDKVDAVRRERAASRFPPPSSGPPVREPAH